MALFLHQAGVPEKSVALDWSSAERHHLLSQSGWLASVTLSWGKHPSRGQSNTPSTFRQGLGWDSVMAPLLP